MILEEIDYLIETKKSSFNTLKKNTKQAKRALSDTVADISDTTK